jgi:hypothetical protein
LTIVGEKALKMLRYQQGFSASERFNWRSAAEQTNAMSVHSPQSCRTCVSAASVPLNAPCRGGVAGSALKLADLPTGRQRSVDGGAGGGRT